MKNKIFQDNALENTVYKNTSLFVWASLCLYMNEM